MAETRLANVIVPSVFTGYTMEPSIYKSRLFGSGVFARNPQIDGLLAGGGATFNIPFWKDISGSSGDIPAEGSDTAINALASDKQIATRQLREKAWGTNAIAKILSGDNPLQAIISMVTGYWGQAYDMIGVATIKGVIAKALAAPVDIVNDISAGTGAAAYFSDAGVIDAQAKLGENGTSGRGDENGGVFGAITVHPLVYAYMRKNDLIDYIPISGQDRPLEVYMNMAVIVDRNAPVNAGVYDTIIAKPGALQIGQTEVGYEPTEPYRDPKAGFGKDILYTRRCFAIHPAGMAWVGTPAGLSATDAELATAGNWNFVFNAENMRFVVLRHKIG